MSRLEFEGLTPPQLEIVDFVQAEANVLIAQNRDIWLIGYLGHSSDGLDKRAFEMSDTVSGQIADGLHIQEVENLQHQYKEHDAQFGRLRGNRSWEMPEPAFVHARLGRKTLQMALGEVNSQRFYGTAGRHRTTRTWNY